LDWRTVAGVKDHASYVYDVHNRLAEIRNTAGDLVHSFGYDVQGNVVNKNSVGLDFDYGNRLRSVSGQESYRYDGLGRRASAWRQVGGGTLSMYTQSGQLAYQESQPLQKHTDHIYLSGSLVATREVAPATGAITTKYQHTDALGSPVAVSNEAGVVQPGDRTNYDPYGGAIGKVVEGVGYTGHVMDPVSGLTYMQQRYYDPAVGRFLSVDPVTALSDPVGYFGRYHYANNNPYKFTDPDGRAWGLAAKVVKVIVKGGDVASTFAGAVEDTKVLFSRDATMGQRLMAAGSLATEVASPVSARDVKAGIAAVQGAGKADNATGVIYRVPGEATPSGKPYIGRTDDLAGRRSDDGRDRSQAEVIGTYPKGDTQAGRVAEQPAINANGGVASLDNKRNEIAPSKWKEKGVE
jgi:RHS repeat-associated protein